MQVDVQNTTVLSADGSSIKLGEYSGEVILVVNVASYCGNTAQYEDLQTVSYTHLTLPTNREV